MPFLLGQRQMTTYLTPEEFRYKYRFSKSGVDFILNLIKINLLPLRILNRTITAEDQLLTALRYYATGSFQIPNDDLFSLYRHVSMQIVCKISRLISNLAPLYISFPSEQEQEQQRFHFWQIAGFPGVLGSVDSVNIPVKPTMFLPSQSNIACKTSCESSTCRFSVTAQLMMDSEHRLNYIATHWHEDCQDQNKFLDLHLFEKLQSLTRGSWLLGDASYPCLPFLLTPYAKATTASERKFNMAIKETRNSLEKGVAIWKSRFPILDLGLTVKLKYCREIIMACAVLHNISFLLNEEQFPCNLNCKTASTPSVEQLVDPLGHLFRETIVGRYFSS